ncbi:MAG: hypothetical protein JXJ04_17220 [Spirochaetales bacterium]|nr:hypothetical protein [Spirochaetales bacterium]
MSNEKGSSSIVVLAIVMFLSTVFLAMVIFVQTSLLVEMENKKATELRKLLIEEAQEVVTLLQEDLDERESDSSNDPVWDYVNTNDDIELKDVGSYLNPNWIDPSVFEHINKTLLPAPRRVFKNLTESGFSELTTFWDEEGIQLNLAEGYKDFFEEEVIEEFMTPYTYFNINLCFEYVLKKLCEVRTGSENDSIDFHSAIKEKLLQRKVILDQYGPNGIEQWFLKTNGINPGLLKKMFPVLNANPVLNVNFAPEEIIRSLLSYKPFGIQNPNYVADRIINKREDDKNKKGLTTKDLKTIIDPNDKLKYPGPRIFHYLGTITNFWEIKVTIGEASLRWIIARVPGLKQSDDPYYKLIEEQIRLTPEKEKVDPEDVEESDPEDESNNNESSDIDDGTGNMDNIDPDYTDDSENQLIEEDS